MKLFFYDGNISDITYKTDKGLQSLYLPNIDIDMVIDAKVGYTNSLIFIDKASYFNEKSLILTNAIWMLSNEKLLQLTREYNKEFRPEIYIFSNRLGKFVNVSDLYNKPLRKTHNIEKLYREGKLNV